MFLIHEADITDDHSAVALFAEDFNFSTLWRLNPGEQDGADAQDRGLVNGTMESLVATF